MGLRKILKLTAYITLILILGAGCEQNPLETARPSPGIEATTTGEGIPQGDIPPQSYPVPKENRKATAAKLGGVSSSVSDGYFSGTNALKFYDAQSGKTVFLCSQPGCTHSDSTCGAWLGNAARIVEYRGIFYYVVSDDAGERLCAKDLSTGETRELDAWKHTEESFYSCVINRCAYNQMTVLLRCTPNYAEVPDGKESRSLLLYDLETGDKRELLWEKEGESLGILAMNREYAVVQYHKNILLEDGSTQFADYSLRLYRFADDTYTVISSERDNGFYPTGDPAVAYGNLVVFQEKDTLCLYDLDKLEKRELLTAENISNYWILDNKVFYIQGDCPPGTPGRTIRVYYADLETGQPVQLGNGGNTQFMEFSISWEGDSFFVGMWNGGNYIIPKADFYLDNYEAAKPGGY